MFSLLDIPSSASSNGAAVGLSFLVAFWLYIVFYLGSLVSPVESCSKVNIPEQQVLNRLHPSAY